MVKRKELIHHLNEELDIHKIEDFGPNGLQVESLDDEPIEKIATAVSTSLKTIEQAIEENVQLLIVHHGLFWNKDKPTVVGIKRDKIKLLLDHNISLLAYHLPLDCHAKLGNNWKAAMDLKWEHLEPFGPSQNGTHLGVKGTFPEISREEFKAQLEDYYDHPAHVALGGKEVVSSAALISGGAHREIHKAVSTGVDCYITGSFDEPVWDIAHEEKINFFAMGHYHTETVGPKALGTYLANKYNLEHKFLYISNPF